MTSYEVSFRVDGVSGVCSIIVQAPDQATAKRVALGQISGQAGYFGKKIKIVSTRRCTV